MIVATKIETVHSSKGQNLPFLDRRDSDQIARIQETVLSMRVTIDRIEPSSIAVARWNRAHTDEQALSLIARSPYNERKRALLSPYLAFKFPGDFRYRYSVQVAAR